MRKHDWTSDTESDLHREIEEVTQGFRGFVVLSKARANNLKLDHLVILDGARGRGLIAEPHGRYGYIAFDPNRSL